MELTPEEIRHKAARGENLTADEMLELANCLEAHKDRAVVQAATIKLLNSAVEGIRKLTLGCRTSTEIEVALEKGEVIFTSSEMKFMLKAYQDAEKSHRKAYGLLQDYQESIARDAPLEGILKDLNEGNVRLFSFKELRKVVEHFRTPTMKLGRPPREGLKQVLDLLHQDDQLFYAQEVRLVRKWGSDQESLCNKFKRRFGQAFTDPTAYWDPDFRNALEVEHKKALVKSGSLKESVYPKPLYVRPNFLEVDPNWSFPKGAQFHAGKHFHTNPSTGKWWSGTHFENLTAAELVEMLETTLGELRLLYTHFREDK